ncbi:MAG: calcium/sodium antiporter [Terrisporobacter othiniensis]|uniref:calcium/sodium antiporter n=1 Tax=Terrisporobacter petrolearius TaxID=1460447 RepID=UPI001F379227|nr:calcium/sodium antiporter [Terrisporobacter petrolearius]MDU4860774.1 calcium/sodium antiporter [Terrisporobacter othiniensis]MDU6995130.1 calcium/sodium antiporter [Terrisporobacter othiniensis]UPA31854.1 calcium/sodium antiporter [Terrisporobacter glycolicus]
MTYIILLIGFLLLIKGADFFVEGSSSIAKKFNIPSLIIGLTIVAFGTSAPEAAVSITAAIRGQNEMAIANVVGSNIFNILFVVGVTAMIKPIYVQKSTILKEFPFLLLSSIVLAILAYDVWFQGYNENILTRADGLIFIALFIIFIYYLIDMAINSNDETSEENYKVMPLSKSILLSIGGLLGIIIGGNFVVNSASDIAMSLGMSENLVGLTIVAIGTSLPELATSIVAAKKGESDIAIGNAVGSNIFNILFVLGVSSCISNVPVQAEAFTDMFVMIVSTIIVYVLAISNRKINKVEGMIISLLYIAYFVFIIYRQ